MKPLQQIVRLEFPPDIAEHSIECMALYYIGNDGIGAYEFWGAKEYDYGHDYVDVEDIIIIDTTITEEEKESFKNYLNENFEDMAKQAEEIITTTED